MSANICYTFYRESNSILNFAPTVTQRHNNPSNTARRPFFWPEPHFQRRTCNTYLIIESAGDTAIMHERQAVYPATRSRYTHIVTLRVNHAHATMQPPHETPNEVEVTTERVPHPPPRVRAELLALLSRTSWFFLRRPSLDDLLGLTPASPVRELCRIVTVRVDP